MLAGTPLPTFQHLRDEPFTHGQAEEPSIAFATP
jgi:hypothetical protein